LGSVLKWQHVCTLGLGVLLHGVGVSTEVMVLGI